MPTKPPKMVKLAEITITVLVPDTNTEEQDEALADKVEDLRDTIREIAPERLGLQPGDAVQVQIV